jgi:hypothetical protein
MVGSVRKFGVGEVRIASQPNGDCPLRPNGE